jgi:hypothetical protein
MKRVMSGKGRLAALACTLWTALGGCLVDPGDLTDAELDVDQVGEQEQAVAGNNLGGENLGGANLGGANLSGTNLGGANLGGANLGGANLGGANLGGANLGGNNLGGINMAATNLGGANLGGANLGGANLGGANLASAGLAGSTATGAYPGLGCPVTGTRNLGTDLTLASTAIDIHNLGAAALKLLHSGEDAFNRTRSCVVLGLGSAAFARLIAQNSGATMYAALRQLPWGFAASAGGAVSLTAWEVVVWGNARYGVFVVVAPTSAAYAGVAGFVKAVWRWNAPPARTLKIGQIGGGQAVQSYTGMMNAGAARLAGAISEKAYLGGELAFITATTNNQTVNVDFASWVRKADGKSLILGNVAGAPSWAEGSIMAVEKPDGSVGVIFRRATATQPQPALTILDTAYQQWKVGVRTTKPVPLRCAGHLLLFVLYRERIPAGKCDPYLTPTTDLLSDGGTGYVVGAATWASAGAGAGPYTTTMLLDSPTDTVNPVMSVCTRKTLVGIGECDPGFGPFPILSETYVHLWDAPYAPYP